jgi:hypothetical protein
VFLPVVPRDLRRVRVSLAYENVRETPRLKTGSSAIRLRGLRGGMIAKSQSGRVSLEGGPTRAWDASTGSGSVEIGLDAAASVTVDLRSHSGLGQHRRHTDARVRVQGQSGRLDRRRRSTASCHNRERICPPQGSGRCTRSVFSSVSDSGAPLALKAQVFPEPLCENSPR